MDIFGLIIGLLMFFMLGNLIVYLLDRNKELSFIENTAVSYLLGQSFMTLLMFWALIFPVKFKNYAIGLIVVAVFFAKLVFFDKGVKLRFPKLKSPDIFRFKNIVIALLMTGMVIKLAYVFVEAGSKPEYSWDACAFWTMSAKAAYYLNRDHPGQVLPGLLGLEHHVYYPKQMAFGQAWLYDWIGSANDQLGRLIFPMTLVAFLLLFFAQVRRLRGDPGAWFFSYFLLSGPLFLYLATIGYADFTIAAYFSSGILFFYRWVREKKELYFWLFSIFISLTAWIKLEGKLWLILGGAIILFCLYREYGRRTREWLVRLAQYFLVYLLIAFPWQMVVYFNRVVTREKFANNIHLLPEMLRVWYSSFFLEGSWGLFWFAAAAAVFVLWRDLLKKENICLLLTGALFFGAMAFTFLMTEDGWASMGVSLNRVLLSLYPVMVFMLAVVTPGFKELMDWRKNR